MLIASNLSFKKETAELVQHMALFWETAELVQHMATILNHLRRRCCMIGGMVASPTNRKAHHLPPG
jgi:hypothetical protein